jgi:cellulose synthase/poly-beta-1,6-N-acetylglucosamine synthase-like glycosyltransferase
VTEAIAGFLAVYGIVALSHLALQVVLGHLDFLRQKRYVAPDESWTPLVSLVVTVYNEDLGVLHRCLRSIDRQDYARLEAFVIDDRSSNRENIVEVLEEFASGRFRVMLPDENRGKREAQRSVLDDVAGEIIVTTDSDTTLPPDCVRRMVERFTDPKIGAVTGDVKVTNRNENLLTRLIGYRYWSAFHQERAAQSFFKVVMCCSGPLSAYRRAVVDRVKDDYVSQVFLGQICTFGDDRHLTNLILREGYDVVFYNRALAHTQAPATISGYIRQQVRWNKSFYREMLWTLKFAHKRHPYMVLDLLLQGLLPFMLMIALAATVYQSAFVSISGIERYLAFLVGIAFLRAAYGVLRTRDPGFFLFVVYGFLHVFILIPTRLYALATMHRTHWGTRALPAEEAVAAPSPLPVDEGRAVRLEEALKAVTLRELKLVREAGRLALVERELDARVREQASRLARVAALEADATDNVTELRQGAGRWNLNQLRSLVESRGAEFPGRGEEWDSYLFHLRSYARPSGLLPASFDWLVEDTFAELLALPPASVG